MSPEGIRLKGADGQTIEVKPKHFYFNTKARCRQMMKNGVSSDARRVYACLELHTMGWQQELAVTQVNGGQVRPLRPSDISDETGLSKQHVRRGLQELEEQGLAERRGALQKGRVELYSWATPRTPKEKNGSHARLPFPAWFPPEWEPLKSLITRLRLEVSIDEGAARGYLSEGEEIARGYQEMLEVAERFVKRVCAKPPSYKEERTERTEEKEPPPPQPSTVGSNGHHPPEMEEEEEATQAIAPIPEAPVIEAEFVPEEPTFQEFAKDYPGEVDPDSKDAYEGLKPEDRVALK